MKYHASANGSCLLTAISVEDVSKLEDILSKLTIKGWQAPKPIQLLRKVVDKRDGRITPECLDSAFFNTTPGVLLIHSDKEN